MATEPATAHVAAASLNQTVGDWSGNVRRIVEVIDKARDRGARLLVLPEMCVPGYSLGDRLLRRGTLERSWQAVLDVQPHTQGIVVCVGLPVVHHGVVYNAMAVLADGHVGGLVCKQNLAVGDVQYENRWFSGWPRGRAETWTAPDGSEHIIGNLLFEADGLGEFAFEICEDGWKSLRPGSVAALGGALILCNPSASWFTVGKHRTRRTMVEQISREDHCAYLYTSLLGCDATRLVFDGSVFIACDGAMAQEGRRFVFTEDYELVDTVVDLDRIRLARMEEGSWRTQVAEADHGSFGPMPRRVQLVGDFRTDRPVHTSHAYWLPPTPPSLDPSLDHLVEAGLVRALTPADHHQLELELGLCLGLRDYVRKSHIRGISLALSGGRDSAMVATLVHRMFRYDRPELDAAALAEHTRARFRTAYLATDHSGDATRNAAAAVAAEMGATHHVSVMQDAVSTHRRLLEEMADVSLSWDEPAHDITLQNVQARLRGSLIWMLANLHGDLLLATSNKSEAAVGYTTMDGDTSGGLAPIADVPKSWVSSWLRWAQDFHGLGSLASVNVLAPTAELRPPEDEQTDEGDLMPFAVLDRLLFAFVQRGRSPVECFTSLWPELEVHYRGDARAFAAHIEKFVKLFCRAQWKRERFAISFRVSEFDLDPKTGLRFPPVQAPFTEELAELRAFVETRY